MSPNVVRIIKNFLVDKLDFTFKSTGNWVTLLNFLVQVNKIVFLRFFNELNFELVLNLVTRK